MKEELQVWALRGNLKLSWPEAESLFQALRVFLDYNPRFVTEIATDTDIKVVRVRE